MSCNVKLDNIWNSYSSDGSFLSKKSITFNFKYPDQCAKNGDSAVYISLGSICLRIMLPCFWETNTRIFKYCAYKITSIFVFRQYTFNNVNIVMLLRFYTFNMQLTCQVVTHSLQRLLHLLFLKFLTCGWVSPPLICGREPHFLHM